jgi:hypothetical protein
MIGNLYLTTYVNHNRQADRQTYFPPVGFDPSIVANEQPQTDALDHAATGISTLVQRCEYMGLIHVHQYMDLWLKIVNTVRTIWFYKRRIDWLSDLLQTGAFVLLELPILFVTSR